MRAALTAGLAALGLDPALCGRLEAFAGLVLERNRVMNLTAITEPSAFAGLHLLDSLSLIPLAGLSSGTVVDVGTGAGFPGVPLAIALPEARVTLLDSLGKRIEFLRETCGALGLEISPSGGEKTCSPALTRTRPSGSWRPPPRPPRRPPSPTWRPSPSWRRRWTSIPSASPTSGP